MALVAVTGATGFIGRAAVAALAGAGCTVRACVRDRAAVARQGLPVTETVALTPDPDWRACVAGAATVLHVAGRAHMNPANDIEREAMRRVNLEHTEALARAAGAAGVRRFVFVSSIGVHGAHSGALRFTAEDLPAPVDFYAQTKRDAEMKLRELCRDGGMQWVIVRPTLVAGAAAPGNLARLARFIRAGLPIPVVSGNARRHLVGVRSLAALLSLACVHPAAAGRVLLAADDPALSAAEMAEAIGAGLGRRARLMPLPLGLLRPVATLLGRGRDLARLSSPLLVDATETRALLGWRAPVPIQEELYELGRAARSASNSRK